MNINLNSINLKQKRELIFIIIVFSVTLFFGKKIWESQKTNLAVIKNKIKDYQEKINLSKEIKTLSDESNKFKGFSWQTQETVSVMGNINELASKYDIEIFNFDPGNMKNERNYSYLTMSLNVKATYSDLVRFLSAIEELPTLTKVINLRISPTEEASSEGGGPKMQANLTIRAFMMEK